MWYWTMLLSCIVDSEPFQITPHIKCFRQVARVHVLSEVNSCLPIWLSWLVKTYLKNYLSISRDTVSDKLPHVRWITA